MKAYQLVEILKILKLSDSCGLKYEIAKKVSKTEHFVSDCKNNRIFKYSFEKKTEHQ